LGAEPIANRFQLFERVFVAVHVRMQARVDVAADPPLPATSSMQDERNVAIGCAEAEVGMKQDQQGPDDSEHHVEFEPGGDASIQPSHETRLRAEYISNNSTANRR